MLDWIFEGIATWVASVMTQIMDAISGVFIGALGTDMTAMEEYFLHPKYASLAEQDLENNSIWELLEKHFSIHKTIRSKKTIEIARAGKEEASALHVSKGEPMLLLRQVVSETDGTPILRIKEYILGDTYKYVV